MFGFKKINYNKEIKDVATKYCGETISLDLLFELMDKRLSNFSDKQFADYFATHKTTIEEWSLNFITNCAADVLGSGELHVYRGLLTPQGNGYLAMIYKMLGRQVELGMLSEEDKDEWLKGLHEEIKSVG